MIAASNLGIWMDHSSAELMEFGTDFSETKTIESEFTKEVKEQSLNKSEHLMHNKEQHQQSEYYKKLGEVIKNYEKVVLFGPTNAKVELLDLLKADHHFDKIRIEVKQTNKMTKAQRHDFVQEHFSAS